MDFRVGILIGASLWLVTEQQQPSKHACTSLTDIAEPCGCILSPETFDLICGSDGHTYLSMCFLDCSKALNNVQISVAHKGACTQESRCSCPAEYEPICATNDVTYSNECVLNCFMKKDRRIQFKYVGECGKGGGQSNNCCCKSKLRRGRTRFGRNGKMSTRCGCGCEKQTNLRPTTQHPRQVAHCPNDPPVQSLSSRGCPQQHQQECPQQQQQGCQQQQQGCQQQQQRCQQQQQVCSLTAKASKCTCAAMHKPVCGTNQQTYANFCVLHCSAKRDHRVRLQSWGECGSRNG